jgi:4-amino-4-deoxy-L-arabinose transferase-like glycosyltransferase
VSENGPAGILRLIDTNLGGQIGWLLPLAVIGLVAAWGSRRWWRLDRGRLALVVWGGWLVTQGTFFSVAGFYHRYYLSMLSPAVAALVGIGVVALWRHERAGGRFFWLLPLALVATAAVQIKILGDYPTWRDRLVPAIAILGGGVALGLLLGQLRWFSHLRSGWIARALAVAGVLTLLIAPATWSGITVADANSNATLPAAGPAGSGMGVQALRATQAASVPRAPTSSAAPTAAVP